jgi:hypothetical protein
LYRAELAELVRVVEDAGCVGRGDPVLVRGRRRLGVSLALQTAAHRVRDRHESDKRDGADEEPRPHTH